jgi:hypothetical protein
MIPKYAARKTADPADFRYAEIPQEDNIFNGGLKSFADLKDILLGKSGPKAIKISPKQIVRTQLGDFYKDPNGKYKQLMTTKPTEPSKDRVIAGYIDNNGEIDTVYLEKDHEPQAMVPLDAVMIEGEIGRTALAPGYRYSEGHHHGAFGERSLKHKRRPTAKRGRRRR